MTSETNTATAGDQAGQLLTRDQIKAGVKLATADVEAFGGRVRVQELSGAAHEKLRRLYSRLKAERGESFGQSTVEACWLSASLVDAAGRRLFTDDDVDSL